MKKVFSHQPLHTDLALLLLRFILGGLLAYHGYTKLIAFHDILPHFKDLIGIGPKLSFILVIIAEFGCGILVTIGLYTRLAVIPISITMFVAFFIAHANDSFYMKELPFVFLLLSIVIFITGSGRISIDKLVQNK